MCHIVNLCVQDGLTFLKLIVSLIKNAFLIRLDIKLLLKNGKGFVILISYLVRHQKSYLLDNWVKAEDQT